VPPYCAPVEVVGAAVVGLGAVVVVIGAVVVVLGAVVVAAVDVADGVVSEQAERNAIEITEIAVSSRSHFFT
jgi:hypothetical protein